MWYNIITEWTVHDIFQVLKHYKRVTRKNETNDRKYCMVYINTPAQIKSDIPHTHFKCKLFISADYDMQITSRVNFQQTLVILSKYSKF